MALNLNLLRSFWHVAQAGSVSGAAQTSFISQPALSKAIRELEGQVGLPLFERGARGVTLTEAGTTLFEFSKAIFALESEAEDALKTFKNLEGGTLRLGASTTVATAILPPVLAQFRAKYPALRFSLARANTAEIETQLQDFQLDIAIVEGPPHSPKIEKTIWRDEEMVLVCAPNHPLAPRKSVKLGELKNWEWLTREPGSGTREVVETALAKYGLTFENALEITGSETIRLAVAANLGIAFVSRESAADQLALGRLHIVPIENFVLRRPFYLLRLRNRPLSSATRAFERFLMVAR